MTLFSRGHGSPGQTEAAAAEIHEGTFRAVPANRHMRFILLICLAVLVSTIFWQTRWGTIPDTSWLIHVGDRLLRGDRLYVDIIETNPPFSIWLYLPVVALAGFVGLAPEPLVHLFTLMAVAGGLAGAAAIARRAGFRENARLFFLAPFFLALFVLFPGNAFSEREHIGTALLLPLLALTAWRMREADGPGRVLAICAGLAASVLVVVKPHYVVVVLVPALYAAWRVRRPSLLLAPEYSAIGLVCTAYLVAVIVLHPEFLRDLFPLLSSTYLEIRSYPRVFIYGASWAIVLFIAWRLCPDSRVPETVSVLMLASAAAFCVALQQAKGWPYHYYPAFTLGLAAMLCALAAGFAERRRIAPFSVVLSLFAVAVTWQPFYVSQKPDEELVATIRSAIERPAVAALGTDIALGHPLTRMVDGIWISAYNGDWLGSYALFLGRRARANGDETLARDYDILVSDYAARKKSEFEEARPDILLVQKSDPIWTAHLLEEHGFDSIFALYRPLVEDDVVAVYMLDRAESSTPP